MKVSQGKLDFFQIHPLLKILNFLSIAPPYDFKSQQLKSKTFFKIQSIGIFIIFVAMSSYSTFGKRIILGINASISEQILKSVGDFAILSLNLVTIWKAFRNGYQLKTIFKRFQRVDKMIDVIDSNRRLADSNQKLVRKEGNDFIFEIVITLLMMFLYIIQGYLWVSYVNITNYQFFFFTRIQSVHINFFVLFLIYILKAIRKRFRAINKFLENRLFGHNRFIMENRLVMENKLFMENNKPSNFSRDTKKIFRIYVILGDIVKTFNCLFGTHILLLLFLLFCSALDLSNEVVGRGIFHIRILLTLLVTSVILVSSKKIKITI